jgi:SAM-dependent methyltransferase
VSLRQESRDRWARSAAGWQARRNLFRRATMPVSTWMVEALDPQPGDDVLELAAGLGDTGFLVAELIAPTGTLICSDFVPEMLAAAQARAAELGIVNVRFRQIDAEVIDQPAASLDGVLCRWGYMVMTDADAALRETRRVLRPGGRLALAAWASPAENPWSSAPVRALIAQGRYEAPEPGTPGQFAWASDADVAEHLDAAGFVEYHIDRVTFTLRFDSPTEWLAFVQDTSDRCGTLVAGLRPDERTEIETLFAALAEPYLEPDGSVVFPAATWVAGAEA